MSIGYKTKMSQQKIVVFCERKKAESRRQNEKKKEKITKNRPMLVLSSWYNKLIVPQQMLVHLGFYFFLSFFGRLRRG